MSDAASERDPAPAVTRSIRILGLLADAHGHPMALSEIARAIGAAKSSTSNLCVVLEENGLIQRRDGGFVLGRRTVELGTGWHPITSLRIGLTLEQVTERIQELRQIAEAHGRDVREITLSIRAPLAFEGGAGRLSEYLTFIGDPGEITRRLDRCAALGITDVLFDTFYSIPDKMETGTIDDFIRTMDRFSREVRPKLAAA